MTRLRMVAFSTLLLLGLTGCDALSRSRGDGEVTAVASGTTGAAIPEASGSASAAAGSPELAPFALRRVPAGLVPPELWTPGFSVERPAGSGGVSLERAVAVCRQRGKDLCTEPQWLRACELAPELGAVESWTLSVEGTQAVVRGAGEHCQGRTLVASTELAPMRGFTCCSRAVAIAIPGVTDALRVRSAERLLACERGLRARDGAALRQLFDEEVVFAGERQVREDLVKRLEQSSAGDEAAFERCQLTTEGEGRHAQVIADCRTVALTRGILTAEVLRVVQGGAESRVQLWGAPDTMSLLGSGRKLRVRGFLGGD